MIASTQTYSDLKVALLKSPRSYPFATKNVELVETHMSWVFLTDQYVLKLKKPLKLDVLDFSTPQARHKNCLEEVKINRRLAKDIYLGVLPLTSIEDGRIEINGNGHAVDWLVWMRRLPKERMLNVAITSHNLNRKDLVNTARALANFYTGSKPVELDPYNYISWLTWNVLENRKMLLDPAFQVSASKVNKVVDALIAFIYKKIELLQSRALKQKIIEAHGDLRPEHIFLGPKPAFIDGMEFCRSLRILDIAEELAFLSLECEVLGAPEVGKVFLETYIRQSGDLIPENLFAFYQGNRALLRARICIRHNIPPVHNSDQKKWEKKCYRYLEIAERCLKEYIQPGGSAL